MTTSEDLVTTARAAVVAKTGATSSEFWHVLAVQLLIWANSIFDLGVDVSGEVAAALSAALAGIYVLGRSLLKARAA